MKDLDLEIYLHNIHPSQDGCYVFEQKKMKSEDLISFLKNRIKNNKSTILKIWNEINDYIVSYNIAYKDKLFDSNIEEKYINVFINSLKGLYSLCINFNKLHSFGLVSNLYSCINKDIVYFSSSFVLKIIDYKIVIEWLHHLILRDIYIIDLIKKNSHISNVKTARGTSGPWSNLDLPMKERVYEWDDDGIEEEISGRTQQRKKQERYWAGLEDYNSPRIRDGFVWREIRNDPYLFDDEDENTYPHRNVLWSS